MSFETTGIIRVEDLRKLGLMPSEARMRKGPVVIVECVQRIPCDACVFACPFGAIVKENINDIPKVDFNKCIGCGACVLRCPGLAIFVVDLSVGNGKALVTVPYEMLPRPRVGLRAELLGRDGSSLGYSRIVKVVKSKDKTYAVTVEVDEKLAMEVRGIRVMGNV